MAQSDVIYEADRGPQKPWIENRKESNPQKRQELNNELSAQRGFYIEYPPDKGTKKRVGGKLNPSGELKVKTEGKKTNRKRVAGK
jgi:hypothetical protein